MAIVGFDDTCTPLTNVQIGSLQAPAVERRVLVGGTTPVPYRRVLVHLSGETP